MTAPATTEPASNATVTAALARWRVTLGFVSTALVLYLARPTGTSLVAGATMALLGEGLRIWAAGHLEKSREVTQSGPYRWFRHPLYVGSSLMGLGVVVASRSIVVALLTGVYLGLTITAAIRSEEAFLRRTFGSEYDTYAAGTASPVARRFSVARVVRNREYRAVAGLAAVIGILCLKLLRT